MIDKKKLKQLRPEERIKKLKQIQEERQKDSKEIEQLIRETEQEAKTLKLAEDVTPRVREVDISELFIEGNKTLEVHVRGAETDAQQQQGYIPIEQKYSDYEALKGILPYATSGNLSENQLEAIDDIGERLEKIKYKADSKKASEIHVASIALHHKIRKYAGMD